MKTTEILKRTYYALTSGALLLALVALLNIIAIPHVQGEYRLIHPIRFPIIIGVFSLIYCWIMSRHNKRDGYILIGVIILTAVLGLAQYLTGYFQWYAPEATHLYIPSVSMATMFVCGACTMTAGFLSGTKYNNLLPNQSQRASKAFRILSWVGQLFAWGFGIIYIVIKLF